LSVIGCSSLPVASSDRRSELSNNWHAYPASKATRSIGDAWISRAILPVFTGTQRGHSRRVQLPFESLTQGF
jgi:hypothetical protein